MDRSKLTRREFMKATGLGVASMGAVGLFPGLSFGSSNFTFGSASAAGSWYPLAVAMSKVVSDRMPAVNVTGVTTPGASRENIMRIDRGEMELGWSTANFLYKGYHGVDIFKRSQKVIGWFSAYPGYYTIAARKSSGIQCMADLKGKTVAIGTPGSHCNMDNVNLIFKNCGLAAGKDFKIEQVRFPDAVQKMIDGHIDACSYFMGINTPGFVQLADSADITFLPLPDTAHRGIVKQDPSYFIGNLPAGTYRGQDVDVPVAAMAYTTICSPDLSEEFMYEATRAVFENLPFITASSHNFKQTTLARVYQGMPVPVHPGAAKYFAEHGVAQS
ncbi:MAG: TAXI family TRAP transporter solute-binding subunit [Desulfobacterales bacterium]|nr:TAXI family TRAP transporter solute-binding subunit [Desulfobacterales bacterium]